MDIQQMISGFRRLSPSDFDLNNVNSGGMERLYKLTDAVLKLSAPESAIPEMFSLMERMPDTELGSPGPLVHTLEAIPGYEQYLIDSIRKTPSLLSVWMVNRILNSPITRDRHFFWMTLLQESVDRPDLLKSVREDAEQFLTRQRARQESK